MSIVLHPGDEIDTVLGPFGKEPVVIVSPVIDDHRARLKGEGTSNLDVMNFGLGNDTIRGQIPFVIKNQMQFNRPFGSAEFRPVKEAYA